MPRRDIIRNPDFNIIVSTISAWEIATKYRIGKLPEANRLWGNIHKSSTEPNLLN